MHPFYLSPCISCVFSFVLLLLNVYTRSIVGINVLPVLISFSRSLSQDQHLSGILIEHNLNDLLLFSPDQVSSKAFRELLSSTPTPRSQCRRSLVAASNQAVPSESSSGNQCLALNSPTLFTKNSDNHLVVDSSTQFVPSSTSLEIRVDNVASDGAIENLSM